MTAGRACAGLLLIVLTALGLRLAVVWQRSGELSQDVDAYLGIAAGLAEGRGYSSPGTTQPTAFRPPLYPLLLSIAPASWRSEWVAILNLAAGAGTVVLIFLLARRLGLPDFYAIMAAAIIAVDPLLVRYASMPMTESVCTLLAAAVLFLLTKTTGSWTFLCGVIFGAAALCRPTFWAFAVLIAGAVVLRGLTSRRGGEWRSLLKRLVVTATGTALVVLPWVIRNAVVMEQPIVTTTHGGYTLLLGNNPRYYEEVVRQPLGTVWDGSHGGGQSAWVIGIQQEMARAGVTSEVAQDHWMSQKAKQHIADDWKTFVRACVRRFVSFWNVVPRGEGAADVPRPLKLGVAVFYVVIYVLSAMGGWRVFKQRDVRWSPALLMIAAFCGVHLLYWSDARMRAPIMPVMALLAANGLVTLRKFLATHSALCHGGESETTRE